MRLLRIVRELEHAGLERPRRRRQHAHRGAGEAAAQVVDDRLAIDRVAERVADAAILQDRIAHVDADVGVVGAGRLGNGDRLFRGQLMDHVRREVVDHHVDGALAQLERAHDLVGHHLQHHAAVGRRAAEVVRKRFERDVVVDGEAHELVRAGADRPVAKLGAGALRHHRHHQLNRKRAERFLQREAHGVRIDRLDAVEHAVRALARRHERRVDETPKRVHHIVRGQLVAVVKPHALAEVDEVGDAGPAVPNAWPGRR